MTEQKKYEVPEPPAPSNYKFEQTLKWDGKVDTYGQDLQYLITDQYNGKLTCTACDEVIRSNVSHDNLGKSLYRVVRHNASKHPELLYVLTSNGWMLAKDLIPDPVSQINDVIDRAAKHGRGVEAAGVGWGKGE